MLRNAKELEHYELRARDGTIGHVADFFFDDRQWTVRYLVIDTGTWLDRREVLISPVAVSRVEWDRNLIAVNLTQEQVRHSPPVDTAQPVSRAHEAALLQYYSWPAYWAPMGFPEAGFGMPLIPMMPLEAMAAKRPEPTATEADGGNATVGGAATAVEADHHLRSVRAVTGHTIEASDGTIGHVDDFLIDDRSFAIRYLIVDTRNWWPGKKVLIAPSWIDAVGWDEAKVQVGLTRALVKSSPAYDPKQPLPPDYSGQLHAHYGRPPPKEE